MRFLASTGAGIAGLGVLFALTTSVPASANAPRVAAPPHPSVSAFRQSQLRRTAATQCSSNNGTAYFVGIPSGSDVAGGKYAGVASGMFNQACDTESAVGGGYDNLIGGPSGGAMLSFIGAGNVNFITSEASFIGSGESNSATARDAMVGAGTNNAASGTSAAIAGGYMGTASGSDAFIGAGFTNTVTGGSSGIGAGFLGTVTGIGSFIGAGGSNCNCQSTVNMISGNDSFMGAGDLNSIESNESFIGSGGYNAIRASALYASILGGNRNLVTGEYASILGGFGNAASGAYAIVAGGDTNQAKGTLTYAAGYHAAAGYAGSFVWSDYVSGSTNATDSGINQFVVRASGGTKFYSNEALTAGVSLTPGSGTWASLSDRNAKTNVAPLDDASILAKVATLPVNAWSYKTERGVRHYGPMAQDFYAAFGTGTDDRHITSIDEDGVALSSIKALYRDNARLHRQNDELRAGENRKTTELAAQRAQIVRLQAQVDRIEAALGARPRSH